MAYVKQWAPRSYRPLELRVPTLLVGGGRAVRGDALEVAATRRRVRPRLPRPAVQPAPLLHELPRVGDARRVGCARSTTASRASGSTPASRPRRLRSTPSASMPDALRAVVRDVRARVLVLSYNDESWVELDELREMCAVRGAVEVLGLRLEAVRRRADRDPQPERRARRYRVARAQPRVRPDRRRAATRSSGSPPPPGRKCRMADVPTSEKVDGCDLCEAARITPWFHEDDVCWIAECEICYVPMVVWRSHGTEPPADAARAHARAARPGRRRDAHRRALGRRQHAQHPRPLPRARAAAGRVLRARLPPHDLNGEPVRSGGSVISGVSSRSYRSPTSCSLRVGVALAPALVYTAPIMPWDSWNWQWNWNTAPSLGTVTVNFADLPGCELSCRPTSSSDVNVWSAAALVLHLEGDLLARLRLDERGLEVEVVELHFDRRARLRAHVRRCPCC